MRWEIRCSRSSRIGVHVHRNTQWHFAHLLPSGCAGRLPKKSTASSSVKTNPSKRTASTDKPRTSNHVTPAEKTSRQQNTIDQFADQFSLASDQQKLEIIAKRLKLPAPAKPGKPVLAWNTTWSVWKALVWVYRLQKQTGGSVSTLSIARDAWIGRLLNWPDDAVSVDVRAKNIWFWLKDLEAKGFVTHTKGLRFKVADKLPDDFAPWQYIPKQSS